MHYIICICVKSTHTYATFMQEELSKKEFLIGVYNYGGVFWILVVS